MSSKKRQIYYKVVTGNLQSACSSFTTVSQTMKDEIVVQYKVGEWVSSRNKAPLYVFETYLDASKFADLETRRSAHSLQIYQCHCRIPRKIRLVDWCHIPLLLQQLLRRKRINIPVKIYMPENTLAFSQIKLLRKVK